MVREGLIDEDHFYGTINCNGIAPNGDVCGVTTTSGMAFKIPGRVGDSPILGAGLYVDGDVGAAGSTGRGEANLYGLCSFVIVEEMRRGAHPKDAGMEALRRAKEATVERRLWGIHLTGPTGKLRWITLVLARTIRGPWASSRPGSGPMRTAWTTWNGCDGPLGSPARAAATMGAGG